jgi:hypothetical protein
MRNIFLISALLSISLDDESSRGEISPWLCPGGMVLSSLMPLSSVIFLTFFSSHDTSSYESCVVSRVVLAGGAGGRMAVAQYCVGTGQAGGRITVCTALQWTFCSNDTYEYY